MARTKATLGTGARLADYLSASLLARVIPAAVVNEVLDAHGRNTQRLRSFPAVVGVYYTVALSLYPEAAYEEVFAAIAQGLAAAHAKGQERRRGDEGGADGLVEDGGKGARKDLAHHRAVGTKHGRVRAHDAPVSSKRWPSMYTV